MYESMTTDAVDPRALLAVAPDDYVEERTRLVKQARAAGDRAAATALQSLKRPNLALWGVLSTGDDAESVRGVQAATTELAKIQAGGSDAGSLSKATQQRRKTVESLVDSAVKALARWEPGAEARRSEIRGIVDQLSRHPDVVDAWIDGTLRDLPDDTWGFGAFADLEVSATSRSPAPHKAAPKARPGRVTVADVEAEVETQPPQPSRAERAKKLREARHDVTDAKRALSAAERRVDAARKTFRAAEKEMHLADVELSAAHRHVDQATARFESAQGE